MPSAAEVGAALAAQLKPLPVDISRMTTANPEWLEKIQRIYRSQVAHVFALHGNLNDYQDDSGLRTELTTTLSCAFDTAQQHENDKQRGMPPTKSATGRRQVLATYTPDLGFQFTQRTSAEAWEKVMTSGYENDIKKGDSPISMYWEQYQMNARGMRPMAIGEVLALLNLWFQLSYRISELNFDRQQLHLDPLADLVLTVAFSDADLYWPANSTSEHRDAIGYLRNWARNLRIGQRNRIILFTRHVADLDGSLTTNDSGVYPVLIKRPDKEQRRIWLENYNRSLEEMMLNGSPLKINRKAVPAVPLDAGLDFNIFSVLSAGMSRKQLEYTIMSALVDEQPVTEARVKQIKQDSVKAEFGGLVDFTEPTHGFEAIGGHEGIKKYFRRACLKLKTGDTKSCPRGVMLLGPPGTAKTQIALAAAKESGMNFVQVDLGKLFGGVIGDSERNTRRLFEYIEASAPVVVFIDEIESALGGGRQTSGDSNTAGRMFSSVLQWLSSDRLVGRVFVIAATNRPDMLDPALRRPGRFNALLPALPPGPKDAAGRFAIFEALALKLAKKHGVKFDKALKESRNNPDLGLGKLLHDEKIWTGAEIESLMDGAIENAEDASHATVSLEDWNQAMEDIAPSTGEVDAMISMALYFANNAKYCPPEWKHRTRNREELKSGFSAYSISNGGFAPAEERE